MEIHLTPYDAWDDFWQYMQANKTGRLANELHVANRTRKGLVLYKGKPKALGVDRMVRLMDKYAPGRYAFHAGEPYFTKQNL